jgi:hypothetical protein
MKKKKKIIGLCSRDKSIYNRDLMVSGKFKKICYVSKENLDLIFDEQMIDITYCAGEKKRKGIQEGSVYIHHPFLDKESNVSRTFTNFTKDYDLPFVLDCDVPMLNNINVKDLISYINYFEGRLRNVVSGYAEIKWDLCQAMIYLYGHCDPLYMHAYHDRSLFFLLTGSNDLLMTFDFEGSNDDPFIMRKMCHMLLFGETPEIQKEIDDYINFKNIMSSIDIKMNRVTCYEPEEPVLLDVNIDREVFYTVPNLMCSYVKEDIRVTKAIYNRWVARGSNETERSICIEPLLVGCVPQKNSVFFYPNGELYESCNYHAETILSNGPLKVEYDVEKKNCSIIDVKLENDQRDIIVGKEFSFSEVFFEQAVINTDGGTLISDRNIQDCPKL